MSLVQQPFWSDGEIGKFTFVLAVFLVLYFVAGGIDASSAALV